MMPCPRRQESLSTITKPESDHWHEDGTCSYCGSLNPDEFMRAIEAGAEVGPTDKGYKAYIEVPNPMAGKPEVIVSCTNPYPQDIERMKTDPAWTEVKPGTWNKIGQAPATRRCKFYFPHLSQEQMRKFVDLFNAGKINIGIPGQFYVFPYFMRRA